MEGVCWFVRGVNWRGIVVRSVRGRLGRCIRGIVWRGLERVAVISEY
jgi:hypothetical protein